MNWQIPCWNLVHRTVPNLLMVICFVSIFIESKCDSWTLVWWLLQLWLLAVVLMALVWRRRRNRVATVFRTTRTDDVP